MRWKDLEAANCPIARSMSVIGDRWTVLILRDCFMGIRRFEDFQDRLGISRPLLATRLQKLVVASVLTKVAYQQKPVRSEYLLTQKGRDLYPVLMTLSGWGVSHMGGRKASLSMQIHRHCGHELSAVLACAECGEAVSPRDIDLIARPVVEAVAS